jgi:hypothetical protein
MPRDDRNRPCRAFAPPLALNFVVDVTRPRSRDFTMPHAEYQDAIYAASRPRRTLIGAITWTGVVIFIIALPFVAIPASQFVYRHFPGLSPLAGFIAAAAAVAIFGIPLIILSMRIGPRLHWKHWKPAALVRGHCPACGHDLAGLPREPDNCTICAECGAAWRR